MLNGTFGIIVATIFVLTTATAYAETYEAAQTDWSGGDGVPGPVTDWGDTFGAAADINWSEAPGDLLLNRALTENVITDAIANARTICAGDIDGDGDVDIAAAVGTSCTWWENADGSGSSWVEHVVYASSVPTLSVDTGDIDGNGDLDIICTFSINFVYYGYWFENYGGSGTFWIQRSRFGDALHLCAADIDGDDDADIVGATDENTVVYWENTDGDGLAWTQHTIDDAFEVSVSVYVADIDGDNDLDVVAAALSGNEVAWWQNDGGSPPVWTKHSVDASFTNARTVFVDDIDDDGDADILGGSLGHETAWWANVDGSGTTWKKEIISDDAEANSVCAADMDDDGDLDVLGAYNSENNIVLYENVDGLGTAWDARTVNDDTLGGLCVEVADVDDDGQPEVVGSLRREYSGALRWWDVSEYEESGELVSSILDTGGPADWGQIDWTDDTPEGTTVKFRARSSSDAGDMGDWSPDITSPGVLGSYLTNGDQYVQYKAILEAADTSTTPVLEDVTIDWGYTDIAVTSFSAESVSKGVEVSWECADIVAGFNLYRSTSVGVGKAVTHRDKLNAGLITGESPYTYLDAAVDEGVTYSYWLEALDVGGAAETFGPVECAWRGALPTTYALYQSRPNPASGSATIAFDLPEDAKVALTVYDISGRKVTTVVDETLTIGTHERTVSGLAPGVYVYRLEASEFSAARKMVVTE